MHSSYVHSDYEDNDTKNKIGGDVNINHFPILQ